ncbi:hypothetical protein [Bradyrhizobium sp.]|uniref:hypothetical protein n=1 Tax=Bradyrhizobium sp. TaxID=376 RepID=UPI001FD9B2D1|nr:hypothetical protein [Bradyrhizobium sp.]
MLLDFDEHDAGADRMDGSSRNEDDVAGMNRLPIHDIGDRASVIAARNSAAER